MYETLEPLSHTLVYLVDFAGGAQIKKKLTTWKPNTVASRVLPLNIRTTVYWEHYIVRIDSSAQKNLHQQKRYEMASYLLWILISFFRSGCPLDFEWREKKKKQKKNYLKL